ncbi:MAG: isocitrate/isopropylmalate family dehydrogenase [Actinomycetota bacterium]|nr:isocitrate/isopropylmalate family dehydrogenase [Actinomycetota bacterium]
MKAALDVLEATAVDVELLFREAGHACYERTGHVVPPGVVEDIRTAGFALKGPFYTPSGTGHRSANFYLRRALDLYACVRPFDYTQLSAEVVLVRENTEDMYAGIEWTLADGTAHALRTITPSGSERIARYAFETARAMGADRVTTVHKANNLKLSDGLFLSTAERVAKEYPEVRHNDMLVDAAAGCLVSDPSVFQVILTTNTFGDILSNVGAAASGSLGTAPTLNVGTDAVIAEGTHGSADSLQGLGKANPSAFVEALGMLLRERGLAEGQSVIDACRYVRRHGPRTPDLNGKASTAEVADALVAQVSLSVSRAK